MALFGSILGVTAQQNKAYKILDVQNFKDSISNKEVQLIDVRTPDEYNSGHIKDAKNIDFYSAEFTEEFNKLDKQKPVYIYCRSGSRSKQSAVKLSAMGFKEIYDLKGGFLNYN
ncbi:MAG: rhodanese-like domain-containing protein [Gelidibacter sp.]|uniref:rhodanese-like domain-containing protein n=1 Tax=Gelidibacter sp. TaxID=2018083 RepID=UPI00326714E3